MRLALNEQIAEETAANVAAEQEEADARAEVGAA